MTRHNYLPHFLSENKKGILLSVAFALGTEGEIIHNLNNNNKKKKSVATATVFLLLAATVLVVAGVSTPLATTHLQQSAQAQRFVETGTDIRPAPDAPVVVTGDNIYIAWWTNNISENGNEEVMFRASTDGGATFSNKTNLSNSTDAESQNAEIVAIGSNNVFVSWWETSPETGSSESVLRVSSDGGQTFGPMIMLGMNGTINTATGNTTGSNTTIPAVQGEEELLPDEAAVPSEEET